MTLETSVTFSLDLGSQFCHRTFSMSLLVGEVLWNLEMIMLLLLLDWKSLVVSLYPV